MALPESIPIRYTDEEAGYITIRPVVRQTFHLHELLDMVLSVTGKDAARIRQILRSGTVVYHYFRYWWEGFEADETELSVALAAFPDADASRTFSSDACITAIFESGELSPKALVTLDRAAGSQRRMFRGQSFWERLLDIAGSEKPVYQRYSYTYRADIYRLNLNEQNLVEIIDAANSLAPRNLRFALGALPDAARIVFICPRPGNTRQPQAQE
jgi:hypothetical protein